MAFRFKLDEPFEEGCRRIAREQIERAQAQLEEPNDSRSRVHETRKSLKRLRALLRLIRPRIGESLPPARTRSLRDIGRMLVERARPPRAAGDSRQARAAASGLRRRGAGAAAAGRTQRRPTASAASSSAKRCAGARLAALQASARFARAAPRRQRLRRRRRRPRDELPPGPPRASRRPTPSRRTRAFHEWRKGVQAHWRHMRCWHAPGRRVSRRARARRATCPRCWAMTTTWRCSSASCARTPAAAQVPSGRGREAARQRQQELRGDAARPASALFAESPRRCARSIAAYWSRPLRSEVASRADEAPYRSQAGARDAPRGRPAPRLSQVVAQHGLRNAMTRTPSPRNSLSSPSPPPSSMDARGQARERDEEERRFEPAERRAGRAGASRRRARPHRRAAAQPRHARRHRLLVDAPLPQGVPLRPARHRGAALEVVADPQPASSSPCARAARARTTPRSGTRSATRARSRPSRARRPRSSRAALGEHGASSSTGPCATPIRRPTSRIAALQAQGCDRILLVPLYPQYAAATTATACDQAFRALMRMRWQPAVRVAPPYHDDPVYIDALARLDARAPRRRSTSSPRRSSPPSTACRRRISSRATPTTASARRPRGCCARRSAGRSERWLTTFQSRFGSDPWLQPYTDETVERLAADGRQAARAGGARASRPTASRRWRSSTCENRALSSWRNGGEQFAYLPASTTATTGIGVIEAVVRRELMGWM